MANELVRKRSIESQRTQIHDRAASDQDIDILSSNHRPTRDVILFVEDCGRYPWIGRRGSRSLFIGTVFQTMLLKMTNTPIETTSTSDPTSKATNFKHLLNVISVI